jgi:hypothetical protein
VTSGLPPFDPNGYRKRVLAEVERRGGPDASDPFELYDLPLDEAGDVGDEAVAARVAEVWGFWQRQRDHPKYRALVALLVEQHAERSAELLDGDLRRSAATRVRARREERDAERYALLDAAIGRLVQRHGGVPEDKVAGLVELGALSGLTAGEVTARLRRHRSAPAPAAVPPQRRRQVRSLLDEFGRLTGVDAPPTLLALLGLGPSATGPEITVGSGAWRARARELPPGRLRAVVDELLVHVAELLEPGPAAVAAYLDAVAGDVTEHLRPRLRAAVLVEDRLVAEDHEHLLAEARARGLDERRALAVLAALAAEAGAEIEWRTTAGDPGRPGSEQAAAGGPEPADRRREGDPGRAGQAAGRGSTTDRDRSGGSGAGPTRERGRAGGPVDPLRAVRAALRAGRPREARRLLDAARGRGSTGPDSTGPDSTGPGSTGPGSAGPAATGSGSAGAGPDPVAARALAGEIDAVLAEAARLLAEAAAAEAERRFAAATEALERLTLVAADVADDLPARRDAARAAVAAADSAFARARALPEAGRAAALAAVLEGCADHAAARDALEAIPIEPPAWVNAARDARGDVVVLWAASTTGGVIYRVRRQRPDGSWQVVGRVGQVGIEDGGAPPGVEAPVYAVAALAAGRASEETRSDAAPIPSRPFRTAPAAPSGPAAPGRVQVRRGTDGTVEITWEGVPGNLAEYRVRCEEGGRWRVVGRTRATRMEDGGAPADRLPVYAVSASVGGVRSGETRSDA